MNSRRQAVVALAATSLIMSAALVAPPPASAAALDSILVTELLPDHEGPDHYEYIEVHNPTQGPLEIADGQISLSYIYADSADVSDDVPLTLRDEAGEQAALMLDAGETAVLWLSYTTASVESADRSIAEFREYHDVPEATEVVRVVGQPGMANGGNRGIRVLDGDTVMSWSFYPAGSVAVDRSAHFRIPAEGSGDGLALLEGPAAPSPGIVVPEALVPADPDPGTDPEPEPTPEPDPDLVTSPLQITELLPNSANVGTADGYEFIEVYNATTEPIALADYRIVYLYPRDTQTNTNEAHWPMVPADAVVEPADSVVLWIKNGQNDDLGDADFNAEMGTELTLGEDLLEIYSAGMANGSARGVAIRTNTGIDVNRAYYNMAGANDVADNQGIRYAVEPEDLTLQQIVGTGAPTPGRVQADQVPDRLMVLVEDTLAPQVTDRTVAEIDPGAEFTIDLQVTDDVAVRTVTLALRNDVDQTARTVNLVRGDDDVYRHVVDAADLMGKSWWEYTVLASDGTSTTRTETVRVPVAGASHDRVRLNVSDGDVLAGTTTVSAASESYPPVLDLRVAGEQVPTQRSLERAPLFVFEVSQTDYYFRNGVKVGDEVLMIFDEGTYADTVTMSTPVPLELIEPGEPLVVSVWAGTKQAPQIDPDENNDDFVMSGMRLVLPDGRTLTPAGYDDPDELIQMGDSPGKDDFYDSEFTLPEDAYNAQAHEWDTTTVPDGVHEVSATDGVDVASAQVRVDNTAPLITPSLTDAELYRGEILLDADITDGEGAGVVSTRAWLDDAPVELGDVTSSVELAEGEHVFGVEATDAVGNTASTEVTFLVPDEMPISSDFLPEDGARVDPGDVTLQARVQDPMGDELQVQMLQGHAFTDADPEVVMSAGAVSDAETLDRQPGAQALAAAPAADEITSVDQLPYVQYDVSIPPDAQPDDTVRLTWDGSAEQGAQVMLKAMTADGQEWVEVDRVTSQGADFVLEGSVAVGEHRRGNVVSVLVQHTEGFAALPQSTRDSEVEPYHPDDVDRSEYDFTFGWETDTQYYNEEFHEHQVAIHDYLLDRREDMDLRYVIHTGDIVDDYDDPDQWGNASPQYARFDDAQLPYGVLAGNHDVGNHLADYSVYSEFFGEHRYVANPWYGGSYEDNRGHYDLVSAGGIDFLLLYMGWAPEQDAIDWMNEVLAQYPDRVGIVNLHEYLLTTAGLGPIPQQIQDEVVATNPNVKMVLSGHYHDATTRIDSFDDDGDGIEDRSVYQMLFDYQGLPEGGQGFLRLLHFDNVGERMMVRTFSPSLDQYNSDDPALTPESGDQYEFQEFEISYADLGIEPRERTLTSLGFTAQVLTDERIASFDDVASGSIVSAPWSLPDPGTYGWYVSTADPYGAVDLSQVRTIIVGDPSDPEPSDPGPSDPGPSDPGPTDPGPTDSGQGGGPTGEGPGDADDTGGPSGGQLPSTGANAPTNLILLAAFALLLGAVLHGAARRRRHG